MDAESSHQSPEFQPRKVIGQIGTIIRGKEEQIQLALTCLFARGHLLIEDLPGIGKTTLAKVLSRVLGLNFRRIQCTSDMLPGDIVGVSVFERKTSTFGFVMTDRGGSEDLKRFKLAVRQFKP